MTSLQYRGQTDLIGLGTACASVDGKQPAKWLFIHVLCMFPCDVLVCACSQVLIKVNKTNYHLYPCLFFLVLVNLEAHPFPLCLNAFYAPPLPALPVSREHVGFRGHNNWAPPLCFDVVHRTDLFTRSSSTRSSQDKQLSHLRLVSGFAFLFKALTAHESVAQVF